MPSKIVNMQIYKSTKNTHVFKATPRPAASDKPVVESVYVEQAVMGSIPANEIEVTVTWKD